MICVRSPIAVNEKPYFDDQAAKRVEALYSTSDVVAQRHKVIKALAPRVGEQILDIGSGPGFLALDLAHAVGPTGRVTGIDISDSMLALAQSRCVDQPWVEFREVEFDAAAVTQVYEYVADIGSALAELHRVLRPGGRALVLDTDWESLVLHTSDPDRSRRILDAWDQHLINPMLPRTLIPELRHAGFAPTHSAVLPIYNPDYDLDTYSYGWISLVVSFVIRRTDITKAEAKAWAEDLRQLAERGEYFFSLNRYLFLVEKPDGKK